MLTINQLTQSIDPGQPTATQILVQQTSPIAIYALMLRSVTLALHEHWDFFNGLIPDSVNDDTYGKEIGTALNTVAATLAEIAATAAQPEMNATVENFQQYTDDAQVTTHVQILQDVLDIIRQMDARYAAARKQEAA